MSCPWIDEISSGHTVYLTCMFDVTGFIIFYLIIDHLFKLRTSLDHEVVNSWSLEWYVYTCKWWNGEMVKTVTSNSHMVTVCPLDTSSIYVQDIANHAWDLKLDAINLNDNFTTFRYPTISNLIARTGHNENVYVTLVRNYIHTKILHTY